MGKHKVVNIDDALLEAVRVVNTLRINSPEQLIILKLMNAVSEQRAIAGALIDYLEDMPSGDEIVDELITDALAGDGDE